MSLGTNIQYLRKLNRQTQEQFAEKMRITRQTVSRWESDEVTPELNKLVEMCSIFSCKLDELVRENMSSRTELYSEVVVRKVPAFKMARYVMISPNPESDVQNYLKNWGRVSGLIAADPNAKLIGWDFPYVSQELQTRFGLHGYVAAYVFPEGFQTNCPGVEYVENKEAEYAVITVTDPFVQPLREYQQDINVSWNSCRRIILRINYMMTLSAVLNMNMRRTVYVIWISTYIRIVLSKRMPILLITKGGRGMELVIAKPQDALVLTSISPKSF